MTLRAILVLLATLAFGLAPFVTTPFRGYDPAIFPVLVERPAIQPAGYAFSIWAVIYLWLIAHAIFGFWKRAKSLDWDETRAPLIVALTLGAVWLFIAPGFPVLATVAIIVMAVAAIWAFVVADAFYDKWLLSAPLAIFAGWLSAAWAVSIGVVVAGYGLLTDLYSALSMLGLVAAISLSVQFARPNMPVYGATVIWALIGVIVANGWGQPLVSAAALGLIAAMAGLIFWQWRRAA